MAKHNGEHSSSVHPDIPNNPGKTNWLEKAGGLPKFIERVAKHIMADSGYTVSHAIAAAVNQVKKWAAKGNKEAVAALADWSRKRASGKVSASVLAVVDEGVCLSAAEEIRLTVSMASEDVASVGLSRVLAAAQGRR